MDYFWALLKKENFVICDNIDVLEDIRVSEITHSQ